MSDTSTSTYTIDEKKKKITVSDNPAINFAYSLSISIVSLGVVLVFGSLFLYTGKIAQSNILPTCTSHEPYVSAPQKIGEQQIDINILKTDKNGIYSTKLFMPADKNMKTVNKTLGFLKDMIYGKNTNHVKLYVATILQELLAFNFSMNNTIFNFMNESFTETCFVLFSPILTIFSQSIIGFISFIYFIILWFYYIYLLFSEKKTEGGSGFTQWTDVDMWGLGTWYWSILYIIALTILLFIMIGTGLLGLFVTILTLFCLFFPLSLKLYTKKDATQYTLLDTIKYVFKFKLSVIMVLISLITISTTNSYLGGSAAFLVVLGCFLAFFFTKIYQSAAATKMLTPDIGNFFQASKDCDPIKSGNKTPTMFEKIAKLF